MRLRVAIPEEHVSSHVLDSGLETVTRLNQQLLGSGRVPSFREAVAGGVRWHPEPPGDEHFDHAAIVVGRRWGDCDDLAPYRAADLRVSGEDPGARAVVVRTGDKRWHAIVQRSDGSREDPSREAGMGSQVNGFAPSGCAGAACAPMFAQPRPSIAAYPDARMGTWHARADLPFAQSPRHALSGTTIAPTLAEALVDAVEGVCVVGAAMGVARPVDLARLFAAHSIAVGVHPRAVRTALEQQGAVLSGGDWTRAVCAGMMFRGAPPVRGYADFRRF